MIIQMNIDLAKIDKSKIKHFTRKDGTAGKGFDLVIFLNDDKDQFGNNGFVAESVPKDSPVKGAILGNVKIAGGQPQPVTTTLDAGPTYQAKPIETVTPVDDLPF